jgi:hypothetical protein|tara:strand:+ start:223 stop:435 length:213 start_codon:yes stop_codon:yes gene_type:complete
LEEEEKQAGKSIVCATGRYRNVCVQKKRIQYNNNKGLGRFGQVWAIVFFSFLSFSKVSVLMERWSEIHGI